MEYPALRLLKSREGNRPCGSGSNTHNVPGAAILHAIEVHALIHAAEEAKHGAIVNTSSESNLAVKIAIVREPHWLAVAMFGESAIHPITSHQRCGLGVMNV